MIGVSWCLLGLAALAAAEDTVLLADIPCIPNQRIASPDTCRTYYICYNDKVMEQVCPDGQYFNKQTSNCSDGFCSCNITENIYDCSHYNVSCQYDGNRNESRNNFCPEGKLFDGILNKCTNATEARCAPDHCIDGHIESAYTSDGYFICEHGNMVYQQCSAYHRFDPIKKECSTACSVEPITVETKQCTSGNQTCGWMRVLNNKTQAWGFNWQCVPSNTTSDHCTTLNPIIDPTDCQSYWLGNQCGQHAFWYQESCFFFRRFNNVTQGCQFSWGCVETQYSERNHVGQVKIADDDCQKYWQGYSDGWVLESCWYFRRFNNRTGSCQWGMHCIDNTPPTTPAPTTQAPMTTPACTQGEKRIDPKDCQKYTQCDHDKWMEQQCNNTAKFNPHSDQCELSDKCFSPDVKQQ